jgi:hypothetical protein
MKGMPKVTEEHEKLHRLAGTWEGEEKMEPSPWGAGGTGKGRYVNRVDLDGFAIVQDYTQEIGGKIVFRGHGVFGVDVPANEVHWYWVDSTGHWPPGPAKGKWDGNTLVMTSSSPQGLGRYTFRFEGKDTLEFRLENSSDGGKSFQVFMNGKYRKVV